MSIEFEPWFENITGFRPHPWQQRLAADGRCHDRLLRIPTGFGKTAGTVLSWAYHRVVRADRAWPTRLVFCLPMRVLVEQTERVIEAWLARAKLDVPVMVLLGGRNEEGWLEHPERPAVLIGTQDMLLSRALARGYGSARGLWPMEMGMLHADALWVVDEVQLMDVGLATTSQLHAFRKADRRRAPALRPTFTWWMSATLQPAWLDSIDFAIERAEHALPATRIEAAERRDGLWEVAKTLERRADVSTPEEIAALLAERHRAGVLTMAIVNTVDRAKKVEAALTKLKAKADVRLVHSRFRSKERASWDFLQRDSLLPPEGRIVVATQVVEAGVDLSAVTLITDLAPWSSLVQRFGRCARYAGESGSVVVVGAPDEKKALPYQVSELQASARALERLIAERGDAGPRSLESFEEQLAHEDPSFLAQLYPFEPLHVLRRRDFDELFDTTPDLSGADLDVSRYIRSGDERDVSVFWRAVEEPHAKELRDVAAPSRDELCPVPVGELRDYLKSHAGWVRDYVSGCWRRADRIVPGLTVMLPAQEGGYSEQRGWDSKSTAPVTPVATADERDTLAETAGSADDDTLSAATWKSISTHGRETGAVAATIGAALGFDASLRRILSLAGRWHDVGKVHDEFQAAIREDARASDALGARRDLAKAPANAWRRPAYPERPGFRHELASTLMLFELLRRASPDHLALTGACADVFAAIGLNIERPTAADQLVEHPLAVEVAALSPNEFNLLAYLVCAHHGKVRTSWSSTPRDQEAEHAGIHGVCDSDETRAFSLVDHVGARHEVPSLSLSLACASLGLNTRYGASWAERVASLLREHGPFALAYLEGLLRAADWRASQLETGEDP